ncbi:MAG: hypothetical protein ACD_20C00098G0006 [uncultured bacterium]|nr:MAG: hypothetical protein ACD_20C00098G0006 [uncultured bacterium]HBH18924.1 ferrous iron transport protein A [Cyanobacteria bacterium UBA9579]
MIRLGEIRVGQKVEILEFIDSTVSRFFSCFGIEKGQQITCIAKPGPVIIKRKQQEIAVGRDLSEQIYVRLV